MVAKSRSTARRPTAPARGASPREPESTQRESESAAAPGKCPITAEQRHRLIAKAAYLRAERRGFAAGHELQDWLEAEAEVDALSGAR